MFWMESDRHQRTKGEISIQRVRMIFLFLSSYILKTIISSIMLHDRPKRKIIPLITE